MRPSPRPSREEPRLNPAQQMAVDRGLLDLPMSFVVQLATGAGKTFLARLAVEATLTRGLRAVLLTPLRALAAELCEEWTAALAPQVVGVYTSDVAPREAVAYAEARALIMTPERLDACLRRWRRHWSWLAEVDLLVVDELHLLADPVRGPRLEGALSRFQRLNPFARIIGLSATLGNGDELAAWLEGAALSSEWRAVPLELRLRRFRSAADKPAVLLEEARRCVDAGGQSIVFVQSRRRAEILARFLVEQGLPAAFHHAGLTSARRQAVESRFRCGELAVVLSTGTLEMGLNLPARQVVLYDTQRFDGEAFLPLPMSTILQRAGRAGRCGLDETGEAVILAPSWDRDAGRLLAGRPEPITSALAAPSALAEQALAELGSGLCRSRLQLERALSTTLAAHQGQRLELEQALAAMLEAGMLEESLTGSRRRLWATKLGLIAVRRMLAPASVSRLARLVLEDGQGAPLTFFDLLLEVASTPDATPVLPVDFEELGRLAERISRRPSTRLQGAGSSLLTGERNTLQPRRLLASIKMASTIWSWIELGDVETVADLSGCYPFEVRLLCESVERLLAGLVELTAEGPASCDDGDEPSLHARARALATMVRYGLDAEAVTLTELPGVGGVLARRLRDAGLADIEELALADLAQVAAVRGISAKRAARLVEAAGELVSRRGATRYHESGPRLRRSELQSALAGWPSEIDPYRLRRAAELRLRPLDDGQGDGARHYEVSGGLEPHVVEVSESGVMTCDCFDARAGVLCKHRLALRLFRGDRRLERLLKRLNGESGDQLDLVRLWLGEGAVNLSDG